MGKAQRAHAEPYPRRWPLPRGHGLTTFAHPTPIRTPEVPHGVRYSLTLHEPYGERILGYDNAHGIKPPKKFKYAGRILTHDHRHRHHGDKGQPYEFQSAHQLLADFFAEVDRILKEVQKP